MLWGGGECSGVEWEIDCNEHSFRRCGIYSVDLRHYLCVARAARAEVESSRRFHLQARADQADELTLRSLAFRSSLICFIWQYDSSIRCTDTPPHCVLGFYRAHSVGSGVCRCLPNLLSFAEPSALVQQSEMLSSVWIRLSLTDVRPNYCKLLGLGLACKLRRRRWQWLLYTRLTHEWKINYT